MDMDINAFVQLNAKGPSNFTGLINLSNGAKAYVKNGLRHKLDGPAFINQYGDQFFCINGKLHREDGPSIILTENSKKDTLGIFEYYQHDKRHRVDGPAIELSNGYKEYWVNGKLHRDNDLPAVISNDGTQKFFINGKLHRKNGPAVIDSEGNEFFYKNGKLVNNTTIPTTITVRSFDEIPANFTGIVKHINDDSSTEYYKNGKLHREDGPAVDSNTEKSFYINGEFHCEEGPAFSGYSYGVLIFSEYYLFGKSKTKEEVEEYKLLKDRGLLNFK